MQWIIARPEGRPNRMQYASMRLALYQPDIPPNTGTILRLGACLGVAVDIIEPCGFPFSDRALRRAAMDYLDHVEMTRHLSWEDFLAARRGKGRIVLLTSQAERSYADFAFEPDDVLLLGRESAGVPDEVHRSVEARIRIPMAPCVRSLNVAMAAAMVLAEALRQTGQLPGDAIASQKHRIPRSSNA
jgi:tRNA (cytidine/uridine-2'-O-)-methyltransferase